MDHKNQKQMICGVESTLRIYCGGDYEEHQQIWLVIITVGAHDGDDDEIHII